MKNTFKVLVCIFLLGCESNIPTTPNGMVWIPEGVFYQGALKSDRHAMEHEKPRHKVKIDGLNVEKILTINGVRFSLPDGSWGLIRASSNKPSLVVVVESPTSKDRMKNIFKFIDLLLQKTGKVGEYDQKI